MSVHDLLPLPLAVAYLALASERVRAWAAERALLCAGLFPLVWFYCATAALWFDPFALTVVTVLGLSCVAALRYVPKGEERLTGIDVFVWLMLFLPLDLRWVGSLWPPKVGGGYGFWAAGGTYLAILGWGAVRGLPSLGHRAPKPMDLVWGTAALLGFGVIAIPAGLLLHFIKWFSLEHYTHEKALLLVPDLVLGVAYPEEVFFRGILDGGLKATLKRPALSLILSSLAFGLMHWPREHELRAQLAYMGFASVAGVFYGLAYRKGGGLPAAVFCHTVVDWVWALFLHR